jgi:hypothetical protein
MTASVVNAEHLAEDLMPGLQFVARAHLDDLALDLRRCHRKGNLCGHPMQHSQRQPLHFGHSDLARARLFGKPDEPRLPFKRVGSFARRDRTRGEQLI